MTPAVITPEQQIANVIEALQATAGRKPYAGQLDELRAIAAQLADMWRLYTAGSLPAITDESPF
jgi:hypothetical protein